MDSPSRPGWCWFHCTVHTYGIWLHGDPRGFRTRLHREHVEGDYKNSPPAGTYAELHARSQRLITQPPVKLTAIDRPVVGQAFVEKLDSLGAEVLALAVDTTHVHVLARMPTGPILTRWLGDAKRHVWFTLREQGWVGKVWAKGSKASRVLDRPHQLNTFRYILRHAEKGAWVWDFRDHRQ